jgi:glycerol-3-phosphate dehydrogenase
MPKLSSEPSDSEAVYDLLVCGGGIFGVCVAYEAARRGLKVCLAEKQDFGAATSANSLKMIHGGLRYLQSLDVKYAFVSARARQDWLRFSPELVQPVRCFMPTTKNLRRSRLLVGGGLVFYNLLTAWRNRGMPNGTAIPNGGLCSLDTLTECNENLISQGMTGGAYWYDAQAISTERLLISLLMQARQAGADVRNYCEVVAARKDLSCGDFVCQLNEANKGGNRAQISASYFIDCSAQAQFSRSCFGFSDSVRYVQAVNVVVAKALVKNAIGLNMKDAAGESRLMFMAPWKEDYCLIGTWYFDTDRANVSAERLEEIVDQVNSAFDTPQIAPEDIVHVHVGRLPADQVKLAHSSADASLLKHARLESLEAHDPHLSGAYRMVGTKWTLARYDASVFLDRLANESDLSVGPTTFGNIRANGTQVDALAALRILGVSESQLAYIEQYFSVAGERILALCQHKPDLLEAVPGEVDCIRGLVKYAIEFESVHTLEDLLVRRMPFGNAQCPNNETIRYCAQVLFEHLRQSLTEEDLMSEQTKLRNFYLKTNLSRTE